VPQNKGGSDSYTKIDVMKFPLPVISIDVYVITSNSSQKNLSSYFEYYKYVSIKFASSRREIELTPIFRTHLKKVGVSFL